MLSTGNFFLCCLNIIGLNLEKVKGNPRECAMVVALPQSPAGLSPYEVFRMFTPVSTAEIIPMIMIGKSCMA